MDITAILEAISGPEVIALAILMAANIILSMIAAIEAGVFSFRNIGDFIPARVVPLLVYLVVATLGGLVEGWGVLVIAVYAGLVALYSTGIAAAVKSLTGISIPSILSERK